MSEAKLLINKLQLRFKGLSALDGVSIKVKPRTLHAIIGPNGAGKSCLLNCLSGFYKPQSGEVCFNGKNLLSIPPHDIVRLGISRTFQNIELVSKLSVQDNLLLGRHRFMRVGVLNSATYWGNSKRQEKHHREKLKEIIALLDLEKVIHQPVGGLPYGVQKRVELGRALATEPSLLLLDEPVAGMGSKEKEEIVHYMLKVKDEMALTVVLVEHDMKIVMGISDYITVLSFGKKIAQGIPNQIKQDPKVIEAYIGTNLEFKDVVNQGINV